MNGSKPRASSVSPAISAHRRATSAAGLHGSAHVTDLLVRFVLGGAVVSAFAAIGELFEPKTFAGLFGAAPSVAVATLALTYAKHGPDATAISAWWMLVASAALLLYGSCCVWICRRRSIPVWLGATASWLVWAATSYASWWMLRGALRT
jgi:hypothetical protein